LGLQPTTQHMHMRCGTCRGLFDGETMANVTVEVAVASMMALRCPHCGAGPKKLLIGQNRTAPEDDGFRTAAPGASIPARAADWEARGETGLSARAIRRVMTGTGSTHVEHPGDMGDLHRCMLLLRRIPEWESRIGEMAAASPQWEAIVAVWPRLSASYHAEAGPDLANWPRPKTGEILRAALADAE
jgi:hypothetical protein